MPRIAVVAIQHPELPNLFLHGLRRDNGAWTLPGGHANDGETMLEAARREAREEAGLDIKEMQAARNGKFEDNDVHLFTCPCPQNLNLKSDNDPDNEFLTFKWLDPTNHGNMHIPKEKNILVQHLKGSTLIKSHKKAESIEFTLGSGRLRDLRRYLGTLAARKAHKRDLEAKGYNLQSLGLTQALDGTGNLPYESVDRMIEALPKMKFHVGEDTYGNDSDLGEAQDSAIDRARDEQRHSKELSDVFQLNYTPEHEKAMEEAGVLDIFQDMLNASKQAGHPVDDKTVGWVRHTKGKDGHTHIDEIQSDFGQSFIKQGAAQLKQAMAPEGFNANGRIIRMTPEEANRHMETLKARYPDEAYNKICQILFNGKHPNEIVHEAFLQHLRNSGDVGKQVHIWNKNAKAKLSGINLKPTIIGDADISAHFRKPLLFRRGRDTARWLKDNNLTNVEQALEHFDKVKDPISNTVKIENKIPAHMQITYDQMLPKLGYKSGGQYGQIQTQKAPDLKNEPTYVQTLAKSRALKISHKAFTADPMSYNPQKHDFVVEAHVNGKKAGFLAVTHKPNGIMPFNFEVNKSHRGKGIGAAMMQHAEHISGKPAVATPDMTSDAKAFAAKYRSIHMKKDEYSEDTADSQHLFTKNLAKTADERYKQQVANGLSLLHPISINGNHHREGNIPLHMTIKTFGDKRTANMDEIHQHIDHVGMEGRKIDESQLSFMPHKFEMPNGQTHHVLLVYNLPNHINQLREHAKHLGPQISRYLSHISIDKTDWDKFKAMGDNLSAHEVGVKIHPAELRAGPTVLKTY